MIFNVYCDCLEKHKCQKPPMKVIAEEDDGFRTRDSWRVSKEKFDDWNLDACEHLMGIAMCLEVDGDELFHLANKHVDLEISKNLHGTVPIEHLEDLEAEIHYFDDCDLKIKMKELLRCAIRLNKPIQVIQ